MIISTEPPCQDERCIEKRVLTAIFIGCAPPPCSCALKGERRLFMQYPRPTRYRGGHAEQIGRYGSPNGRKFEKRRANRLRRRAERLDPENAPVRCIRGWND